MNFFAIPTLRRSWITTSLILLLCTTAAAQQNRAGNPVDVRPLKSVQIERAFADLSFRRPIVLTDAGDGTQRLFVASQHGQIHILPAGADSKQKLLFLDIEQKVAYKDRENEEGLLGLAFHPKFKTNGYFFVYYTLKEPAHTSVVSRFRVLPGDPNRADPDFEEELLRIKQPYWNHNGGNLMFGPQGNLFIGLGDGGKANDPHGNGQNLQTLLGSLLRIDVDHKSPGKNYAIPADNPFAGPQARRNRLRGARPEIYAYGIRNIWGLSYDPKTKLIYAADVGQNLWEEINIIEKGGNYGWNLREGFHPFPPESKQSRRGLIAPIWEYAHTIGKSVTGGYVYRGSRAASLVGYYLYADYVTGRIWALKYDEQKKRVTENRPIDGNVMPVMAFGRDAQGEIYFMSPAGKIHTFATASK